MFRTPASSVGALEAVGLSAIGWGSVVGVRGGNSAGDATIMPPGALTAVSGSIAARGCSGEGLDLVTLVKGKVLASLGILGKDFAFSYSDHGEPIERGLLESRELKLPGVSPLASRIGSPSSSSPACNNLSCSTGFIAAASTRRSLSLVNAFT